MHLYKELNTWKQHDMKEQDKLLMEFGNCKNAFWVARKSLNSGATTPAGKIQDAASSSNVFCLLLSFSILMVSLGLCCCSLLFCFVPCSCQLIHELIMSTPPHLFNLNLKGTMQLKLCHLHNHKFTTTISQLKLLVSPNI